MAGKMAATPQKLNGGKPQLLKRKSTRGNTDPKLVKQNNDHPVLRSSARKRKESNSHPMEEEHSEGKLNIINHQKGNQNKGKGKKNLKSEPTNSHHKLVNLNKGNTPVKPATRKQKGTKRNDSEEHLHHDQNKVNHIRNSAEKEEEETDQQQLKGEAKPSKGKGTLKSNHGKAVGKAAKLNKGDAAQRASSKKEEAKQQKSTEAGEEDGDDNMEEAGKGNEEDSGEEDDLEDKEHSDASNEDQDSTDKAKITEGFAGLVGIGEGLDDSDSDGMLEQVDLALLPSQTISEARNDEAALELKLTEINEFTGKKELGFWESLSVRMPLEEKLEDELAVDDLKRERRFAELATEAVHMGLGKLRKGKVKFRRPRDYFAEMIKTDGHMGKVKGKLLYEKERIQVAEKRRNNRDIAKNRKKVRSTQMEREQAKKRKAKEEIEAFTRLRKQRLREREQGGKGLKEGDGDDEMFPIDLLEVEQLDEDNRFRPQKEFGEGKRKAWSKEKDSVSGGGKAGGRGSRGLGKEGGDGPAGGVQKPKKGPRGKKKRLGRSRRMSGGKKTD